MRSPFVALLGGVTLVPATFLGPHAPLSSALIRDIAAGGGVLVAKGDGWLLTWGDLARAYLTWCCAPMAQLLDLGVSTTVGVFSVICGCDFCVIWRPRTSVMRTFLLLVAFTMLPAWPAAATFSIVAFDPVTGDLGIAVASRYFAVGAVVPWAEAGVGAIATQAGVNVGYGPRGLELLRQGLTAEQVLEKLMAEDAFPRKDARQVAIVDAKGNIAVFTGDAANAWRGHVKGKTWSAQGNILVGQHVVDAMGRAFDNTNDELAEKLYAALRAGDEAGGDSRGRQSASILVVRKGGGRNTNNDRYVFINVDDHPDPMHELRRLMNLQMSINHGAALNRSMTENNFSAALQSAEKLATYQPLDAAQHLRVGFVAYLAGGADRSLVAFLRAKQLMLPEQFQTAWDQQIQRTAAYKKVVDDKAFVARVFGAAP